MILRDLLNRVEPNTRTTKFIKMEITEKEIYENRLKFVKGLQEPERLVTNQKIKNYGI